MCKSKTSYNLFINSNGCNSGYRIQVIIDSPNQISAISKNKSMQKREQGKSGGAAGGNAAPPPKRGRPFGSTAASVASASAADSVAPSTHLGPSLQIHNSFSGNKP